MTDFPYDPTDQMSEPETADGKSIGSNTIAYSIRILLSKIDGEDVTADEMDEARHVLERTAENQNWVVYVP